MNTTEVRTRFAPSPTGYLHVGGARTAMFNWLFARKHGGTFILRIEDTDKERNTEEALAAIFQGLHWLEMDWDEGPNQGGEFGPYSQSERLEIYDQWFEKLISADRVYEEDGAWRFRFDRKLMTINDLVCGEVSIDYTDESINPDMVVKRSDGSYTFHFVNVVDDIEMKLTHVIRGEDHLMNTPKHLQLFEAFNITPPIYAHIPLILNMDGSKMSKRDQGAAIAEYSSSGYLAESTFNFLALLGWSPKDDQEIFSIQELIAVFDINHINRAPAKFDPDKCKWFNQQHIAKLDSQEFAKAILPHVTEAGIQISDNFEDVAASVQEKVSLLTEAADILHFFYNSEYPIEEQAKEKVLNNVNALDLLTELETSWASLEDWSKAKETIGSTAKANGSKPGQLMFPTRVALSGMAGGPDLGEIIRILGQEECIKRIRRFITLSS